MVLSDSVATSRTRNTTCNCQHNADDHYLVRCGCLNDRPSSHPMHINDDAFHHTWCHICRIYCYKDAMCPNDLPDTHTVRLPLYFLYTRCLILHWNSTLGFRFHAQIYAKFNAIEREQLTEGSNHTPPPPFVRINGLHDETQEARPSKRIFHSHRHFVVVDIKLTVISLLWSYSYRFCTSNEFPPTNIYLFPEFHCWNTSRTLTEDASSPMCSF